MMVPTTFIICSRRLEKWLNMYVSMYDSLQALPLSKDFPNCNPIDYISTVSAGVTTDVRMLGVMYVNMSKGLQQIQNQ